MVHLCGFILSDKPVQGYIQKKVACVLIGGNHFAAAGSEVVFKGASVIGVHGRRSCSE